MARPVSLMKASSRLAVPVEAMILSGVLLLRYIGEPAAADRLEQAVKEILAEINEKEPKTEDAPASLKRVKGTRINKMVLHGFKSFASRTELLFGENFNVVLGPNGSGKSNIIDAVCFVLGKSSSKFDSFHSKPK